MQNVINTMKNGIAVAGSILVDKINEISAYPKSGELTKIINVERAVGGCVPNVAIDLKRIDKNLNVFAVGKIGKDDEGHFVKDVLSSNGVDVSLISTSEKKTSFTDVMSVGGGQRTFFTYPGASADFGYCDVPLNSLRAKMLHLGYFLLLDKIDSGEGERILKDAQSLGIKTSIDLVTENSDRYSLVIPCLKYTDNVIINEIEASRITGIECASKTLKETAEKIKSFGVKERVIIHSSFESACLSNDGFTILPSYDLPEGWIKGSTGAGDAFCAGALLGIYRDWSDEKILSFASSVAVSALSQQDAISGVLCEEEILKLCKDLNRRKLCL